MPSQHGIVDSPCSALMLPAVLLLVSHMPLYCHCTQTYAASCLDSLPLQGGTVSCPGSCYTLCPAGSRGKVQGRCCPGTGCDLDRYTTGGSGDGSGGSMLVSYAGSALTCLSHRLPASPWPWRLHCLCLLFGAYRWLYSAQAEFMQHACAPVLCVTKPPVFPLQDPACWQGLC